MLNYFCPVHTWANLLSQASTECPLEVEPILMNNPVKPKQLQLKKAFDKSIIIRFAVMHL